jgi:hypothetical protein
VPRQQRVYCRGFLCGRHHVAVQLGERGSCELSPH